MSGSNVQMDTKVMAKAPAHVFANPVGLLQDFHQTRLLTYLAFWMGGWMDGEILLTFTQLKTDVVRKRTSDTWKYKQDKTVLLQVASMLLIRPLGNIPGCPKRNIKGTWCETVWLKKKKNLKGSPLLMDRCERTKYFLPLVCFSVDELSKHLPFFYACKPGLWITTTKYITSHHVL